jgi:hypothetical protein
MDDVARHPVHGLLLRVAQRLTRLPVVPVPAGLRFRPVDPGEVAARRVDLALGTPAGLVADLGGPDELAAGQAGRPILGAGDPAAGALREQTASIRPLAC